jgi:hypothetical protein
MIADGTPTIVNSSVRKYLTEREVERLIEAARKGSRWGHRDATMILVAYRHGLRASELCDLEWHQVELDAGRLHVRRAKNGSPSVHPLRGDEIRALRRLQREQEASPFVFCSERGGPMTPKAFHALFGRIGARAKMPFPASRWPTPVTTRGRCKLDSVIRIFSTRSDTASLRRIASSTSGGTEDLTRARVGARHGLSGSAGAESERPLARARVRVLIYVD